MGRVRGGPKDGDYIMEKYIQFLNLKNIDLYVVRIDIPGISLAMGCA